VRIVLLHGHGSNPAQMAGVAAALQGAFPDDEVLVPRGSIELAAESYGWFDDPMSGVVSGGPRSATQAVAHLARVDLASVDLAGSVVCGFSQGAAVAIASGFLSVRPRAVVAVCGFLPEGVDVVPTSHPLLLVAGDDDEVVDAFYSESLARQVKKTGSGVTLTTVATGHLWTPEITQVVVEWLRKH
jgi:predicted esterase